MGVVLLAGAFLMASPGVVAAHTPESPFVKDLIAKGVASLGELPPDDRLGGQAVVALALYKAGHTDHPRVREAISACRTATAELKDQNFDRNQRSVYSIGLATMLLAATGTEEARSALANYLDAISDLQKNEGGWGYLGDPICDTSQTQYIALALWELRQSGVRFDRELPKRMIEWIHATQDPTGSWGYKGNTSEGSELKKQSRVSPTMTAAALSSLMIGADLFGLLRPGELERASSSKLSAATPVGSSLPKGVRMVRQSVDANAFNPSGLNWGRTREALRLGDEWIAENATAKPPSRFANYYLYTLERYHSFREYRVGIVDPEPDWYTAGVDFLAASQQRPGVWEASCDEPADTAFAVLFLLRATQKSIRMRIGEGSLVSGRGLPKNIADATLRRGQVIVELDEVSVGDFLAAMSRKDAQRLDSLADDPDALVVGELSEADVRQLEQLLRGGQPGTRRLAARALGRSGELDRVPAMLYALTDPDRAVAREARDGLRFISRKTRGYGMPDEFSDEERYAALERWKRWYLALRPEAVIDVGR